jgi:CRISPR-associated protein Cmr5
MSAARQGTRSQRHAEVALARIKAVESDPSATERKEYKARADGFPVMVMQAGLAQAVGFMRAKASGKKAYGRYLDDLAAVLGRDGGEVLQNRVIAAELPEYRQLTREALAAAGWLKRFGQAYLSRSGGQK